MSDTVLVINNKKYTTRFCSELKGFTLAELQPHGEKVIQKVLDMFCDTVSPVVIMDPISPTSCSERIPCLYLGSTPLRIKKFFEVHHYFYYIDDIGQQKIGVLRSVDKSDAMHIGVPVTRYKFPPEQIRKMDHCYKKALRELRKAA